MRCFLGFGIFILAVGSGTGLVFKDSQWPQIAGSWGAAVASGVGQISDSARKIGQGVSQPHSPYSGGGGAVGMKDVALPKARQQASNQAYPNKPQGSGNTYVHTYVPNGPNGEGNGNSQTQNGSR